MTPLSQMAQIGCPEPRLIVIKPFDASAIPSIEKAIRTSNLGLNPMSRRQGDPSDASRRSPRSGASSSSSTSRTRARRRTSRSATCAATATRRPTRSSTDRVITEDQLDGAKESVQELTKTYEGKVKELVDKKSAELME